MKSFLLFICLISCFLTQTKAQVECVVENSISLNQGSLFRGGSGRVEICVCSGAVNSSCYWQTVSAGSTTQPMSWMNSIVVCRELGYLDAQSPILQDTVPVASQASSSIDIYPTTFECDGTESALIECATGSSTSALAHTADAYVSCETSTTVSNRVRLTGSFIENTGAVEYYVSGTWRTICPDSWTSDQANLLCTSLGYISGTTTEPFTLSSLQGRNISEPTIASVSCTSATYFSSCTPDTIGEFGCSTSTQAAGVICQSSTDTEGSVRLFDTTNSYDRVEVLYNGRWGTVCETAWDSNDANVACRELGRDVSQTSIPSFAITFNSESSRPIWIQGYICTGDESSLSTCTRPPFPVGYVTSVCSHSDDAGITCADPPSSGGGGLSGGAIAGIVIGCLVFLGIVGWFLGASDRAKKRREASARQHQATAAAAAVQLRTVQQTTTTTTSTVEQTRPEPEPERESIPATSQLAQVPPPSYNEALVHTGLKEPPQYPDEEKKVPYPVTTNDSDPAYPSAPPGPNDYQGYPPPNQQPAGYMPPPPNAPYPVDPYPQSAYPPPPPGTAAATAPLPYPP